jgi:hypothetical protein
MNLCSGDDPTRPRAASRWPWLALALSLAWIVLARVPLLLNAEAHLDSDLAVDGLTLLEARQGDWRWHYPGTPHMGIAPVLLSWPQSLIWGANPWTLVSGGVLAYVLLTIATFALAWRASGPTAAAWSLVPLTFASTGAVWLSGRITGGHLLAAAWHALAFLLLAGLLRRGGIGRAAWLGLWCGLGLYLDQLFLFTMLGLVPAALAAGFGPGRVPHRFAAALAFVAGTVVGYLPHVAGTRADPYDAYGEQFETIFTAPRTHRIDIDQARRLAGEHTRLLVLECLPRLVAGPRFVSDKRWGLHGVQHDPPQAAAVPVVPARVAPRAHPAAIATLALGVLVLLGAIIGLLRGRGEPADAAELAVRWGLLASGLYVVGAFVINRNIYNSDNYRYLVTLLVPLAVGFGLWAERIWRGGRLARAILVAFVVGLAGLQTSETARWYRGFGWLDARYRPVRVALRDPALDWLRAHPEIDLIYGSYWDVYRLSFLLGGRVRGVPFPEYPDRYGLRQDLPGGRARTLVARTDGIGQFNMRLALEQGGRLLAEAPGLWIIDWPLDTR